MKSMKEIERIRPAMVSCSNSVNGGWKKKKGEGPGEGGGFGGARRHGMGVCERAGTRGQQTAAGARGLGEEAAYGRVEELRPADDCEASA